MSGVVYNLCSVTLSIRSYYILIYMRYCWHLILYAISLELY